MNKILYDLTNPQKNIWITEQFYKGNSINNICGTVYIKQELDFEKLLQSVNLLIKTHDNFKIKIQIENNKVKQYIDNNVKYTVEIVDIANETELTNYENSMARRVLSVENNQLFEIKIFKLPNKYGGVIVKMHHLLADSWTFGLICKQIVDTYYNLIHNLEIQENQYSYIDYINKEQQYMESDTFKKDKEYWNNLFETVPETATIPSTSNRRASKTNCNANRKTFNLSKKLMERINAFCQTHKISAYNFFMSIFSIYLSRVSNLDNLVIGTPILNRTNFADKNTNGMFVSTVPFRINIQNSSKFYEFTQEIAKDSMSMLRHQRYPYQNLLEDLRKKDSSLPNLYSVILSYQITKTVNENIDCESHWVFNGTASDDLQIHIVDYNNSGSLNILYDYSMPKYCEKDILDTHNRIVYMINQVLDNESILVKDIDIVTEEEKSQLLYEFNNPNIGFPEDKTIVDLFEEQVSQTPNNISVTLNNSTLTYKDLNEKANQLARYLIKNGIQKGDVIGIRVDKSFEMIIGILAIIKAGCTYLPINMSYPQDRVEYMLTDSNAKFLLTVDSMINDIDTPIRKITIDLSNSSIYCLDSSNLNIQISPEDLIYIIYTSGSTGKPKGAMLCHRNIVRLFKNDKPLYDFTEKDVWTMFHSVAFDFSVWEMYGALLFGGKLVLVPDKVSKDTNLFLDLLRKEHVTVLNQTPTYFYNLLATELERADNNLSIRYIIFGGEALKPKLIQKWAIKYPNTKLINMYGITETTVHVTFKELTEKDLKSNVSNIGKPIPTLEVLILDKNLHLLPYGVPGEMCVLGQGVFNGYLNREDLNRQKLIYNSYYGQTLYHSGDLAILHKDGNLEYLGRIDKQVKLRGFRVELGEIEEQILKNENIKTCIVTKKVDKNNRDILCAYYIRSGNINIDNIKKSLQLNLPYYMIPQYFVEINQVPININGKVDIKSLPIPDEINHDKEIVKPRNSIDNEIIKAFKKILGIKQISIEDSFFELGGDSLSAISICTYLNENININITVKDILDNPIIKDLSDSLADNNSTKTFNKISIAEKSELYPLSSAQRRIYYACKMIDKDNLVYNTPGAILIDSLLDADKVEKCFNSIIEKQDSFRTIFTLDNGEVKQKILDSVDFKVETTYDYEENINKIINNFARPFNLETAPLLRVQLCYLDNKKTLVLFDSHHIIMDGSSLHILIDEFCRLYNDESISQLPIQYKDYAVWEDNLIKSGKMENLENYWLNKFKSSEFPSLNLPYDYSASSANSYVGSRIIRPLDKDLFNKVENIASKLNVSPYMLFISAFFVLLYKYTGQKEIIIGTPFANRNNLNTNDIIGMFVNNICIDAKIDSEASFVEFLNSIKDQVLSDLNNGMYPYDLLIKKLNIPNNMPLFNTMFTYQNTASNNFSIDGNDAKLIPANIDISKFNLSFEINPNEQYFNIEYRTDLFNPNTIKKLYTHYINALNSIINNNNILIKDINILSEEERNEILYKFNDTYLDYSRNKTIFELFEQQVKQTPENIALIFEGQKLTYKELNEKANQLAHYLRTFGVKANDIIGIIINRSVELIISMLAILKAGAAYLPIDPTYPESRISYILKDSHVNTILTSNKLKDNIKNTGFTGNIIITDLNDNAIYHSQPKCNLSSINTSSDYAYIIYTSGSTGNPKGVLITHKNVNNFINSTCNRIKFSGNIASVTTFCFDIFVLESLLPLQKGLTIVLANEQEQNIPQLLNKLCMDNNVKMLQTTPSKMSLLLGDCTLPYIKNLETIMLGGEPFPKNLLNILKTSTKAKIYNMYGPTETTVWSSIKDLTNTDDITIGTPIGNTQFYILDNDCNLLPIGFTGHLYIGGDGISKGYFNKQDLTSSKFINDPFKPYGLIYNTGDLAKWENNGEITYIGRSDFQVKIRGLRIELEEIENKILDFPNISKVVACVKKDSFNRQLLCAYFTSEDKILVQDLRSFLAKHLPNYMIPTYFIQLIDFKYTPNGKIDRNALPTPEIHNENKSIVLPETETEIEVSHIFEKLLMINPISINDNFFEIGGDSLLALKLQIELLNSGFNISFNDIYKYNTIKQLALRIDLLKNNIKDTEYKISKTDFTQIDELINNVPLLNNYQFNKHELGNVLLTGATGFLGAHILSYIIDNSSYSVYCLIRKNTDIDVTSKLLKRLNYYFGNKYDNLINKRIFVINSDITKDNLNISNKTELLLNKNINCVINSAANVKHYGYYSEFEKINVIGVKNLVDFCNKYNKKFIQISTTSVSGNSLFDLGAQDIDPSNQLTFAENNLYIGQSLDNVYIRSKFYAEKLILDNIINNGLDALILRVGNITNRSTDGKFQPNANENAFANRIKVFMKLKYLPNYLKDIYAEFSPVDNVAEAIVKSIEYTDDNIRILHIYNQNHVYLSTLINMLDNTIKFIDDNKFKSIFEENLKIEGNKDLLSLVINDLDKDKKFTYNSNIKIKNDFSKEFLDDIGFKWANIDKKYIDNLIKNIGGIIV